jgi:hypothetical protein
MRKMVLAIERRWKTIGARKQTACATGFEVMVCLLLCGNGAMMAINFSHGWWLRGGLTGAVALFLGAAIVWRNYWIRRFLAMLKEENRQLMEIALAAVALKLMVENGLPINLTPLTQCLDAFHRKPDLFKMN